LIEIANKLVKKFLLGIGSLQEREELFLNNCLSFERLFPLLADTPEDIFHLAAVV
jgi:hypothetical protein